MDLSEEIKDNDIILSIVPKEEYRLKLIEISKSMGENLNKICYISVNSPYSFVLSILKKNNVPTEKFYFIDVLTRKAQASSKVKDCMFISSPKAFTELSLAFYKALNEQKCDSALIDSISALSLYGSSHLITRLVHDLLTKLRVVGGKAIFVALKEESPSELIKDLYMFVDKAVDLSKKDD